MSEYNKLIGSIVGGAIGIGVSVFGLPAEWQDPQTVTAITTVLAALATFIFPANKPS